MKKKTVIENLIVSTLTQLITLILGMILPRLILLAWGSEYNGLLSSVTNILRYLSVLKIIKKNKLAAIRIAASLL